MIRPLLTIALLLMLSAVGARSQTLVNRGAIIHIKEGALVHVNGDTENREGEIRVYDAATVTFNGNVRINFGGIYLLRNSFATITRDLTIGYDGTCWRYDPGALDVYGTIFNDGDLNNDGEINIGRP